MEIAKAKNIAPYMIFHDKTLIGLANVRPKNSEEMLEISGVGDEKLCRYGKDFLAVILEG